eukprot:COSAG01_NODE_43269_length_431_cov_1.457831_1_plen_65_part_01
MAERARPPPCSPAGSMALKRGTTVQLNSCSVKVKEQLSEGGFAYVLRVRDAGSGGREFALKQINC